VKGEEPCTQEPFLLMLTTFRCEPAITNTFIPHSYDVEQYARVMNQLHIPRVYEEEVRKLFITFDTVPLTTITEMLKQSKDVTSIHTN
jgi:hypothetical protein